MKKVLMSVLALGALMVGPAIAQAAVQGYATANVNMRSGPSTAYPAVTVIPVGAPVTINGCMSSVNWCDVSFVGGRGWVSGNYVEASYRSNRVYVAPDYYQGLGIPTVTFEVDNYWGRYYRGRDFYRERDRWRSYNWRDDRPLGPPPRPAWDGHRPPPGGWDRGPDRRPPPGGWDRGPDRGDDRRPPPPRGDRGDDRRPPPGGWDRGPDRGPDRGDDRRPPPRGEDRPDRRPPQADRPDRRPPPTADRPDRRPPAGDNNGRPPRAEQRNVGPDNDTNRRCLPGQCGN